MKYVLAIDPGPEQSAWLLYDVEAGVPVSFAIEPNEDVLSIIGDHGSDTDFAVEMIKSYGMAVGSEVFLTCCWIGRFVEKWRTGYVDRPYLLVFRQDAKKWVTGSHTTNDAGVHAALVDRYRSNPDALKGVKSHIWAALAVAVTYAEAGLDPIGRTL